MKRFESVHILAWAILALSVFTCLIWYTALREDRHAKLTVSFLDIGQGDSIYIESPTGMQVLIDGGPDTQVLRRLSDVMPWYDRSIDLIIPTHPDADHVSGLVDVLSRYQASYVLQSSVLGDTTVWNVLEKAIVKEGSTNLIARRGRIIDIGGGAYLEILAPDREVRNLETNTACVVAKLVYGKTAFMLTCDAPQAIEKYLVELDGTALKSNVLKAGHHGSKNSSSPLFIGYVDPQYVVYSRGCKNRYGHPNGETVATFARFGLVASDTCKEGTITFVSDGAKVVRQ